MCRSAQVLQQRHSYLLEVAFELSFVSSASLPIFSGNHGRVKRAVVKSLPCSSSAHE